MTKTRVCMALIFAFAVGFVPQLPAAAQYGDETVTSFWPFYYKAINKATNESEIGSFGPIFSHVKKPSSRLLAIRPFYAHEITEDADAFKKEVDLFWPFVTYHEERQINNRHPYKPFEEQRFQIVPVVFWSRSVFDDHTSNRFILFPFVYWKRVTPEKSYFIIFPFYWRAKNSTVFFPIFWKSKKEFFAIFPFYGKFEELWGAEETVFYLWPLFVKSKKGEARKYSFLYPFVSVTFGGGKRGYRLFPFFGYKADAQSRHLFLLWPFGHYWKGKLDSDDPDYFKAILPFYWSSKKGDVKSKFIFPFYGKISSPHRVSKYYLFPLYGRIVDDRDDSVEHRFLSFLFRFKTSPNHKKVRFLNLYGVDEKPDEVKKYLLWPLFTSREKTSRNTYTKNKFFPPFYFSKYKKNLETGEEERKTFLLPLFSKKKFYDGSQQTSSLWLFWYDESPPMERNYAPLWRIYSKRTNEKGEVEKTVLGKLYRSFTSSDKKTTEWNFLFFHRRKEVTFD